MRIVDIINKKKNGFALAKNEIEFVVDGFTKGEIPDYQMSALLMAIYFKGMDEKETNCLTMAMANSGDVVDLSEIPGIKVDKHSTGGVGDKTSLILAPIVASYGVYVAKMSGRGLGHTGGTIDKLEAIPGLKTSFSQKEFINIVKENGLCIGGSGDLAPADKKIYALRDVTATVDNISLIASSIMSKKIAAGSDCILLDVKTGSGAFMKSYEDSVALAKEMVKIGDGCGRKTVAIISDMGTPLGNAIGNTLEICEVIDVLHGNGPKDLTDICVELAANMLNLAGKGELNTCREMAQNALKDGSAFEKFKQMIKGQYGHTSYIDNPETFEKASILYEVESPGTGYISAMNAEELGVAAMILGAGRETSGQSIDFTAGIILKAKTGDFVEKGQTIAVLHCNDMEKAKSASEKIIQNITFSDFKPEMTKLFYSRVDVKQITEY